MILNLTLSTIQQVHKQ